MQFDSATPLRTPQRRAPKLLFTPLRPTQFTNQEKTLNDPIQPAKPVFEGVVLSPPDSSFLKSFVPIALDTISPPSSEDDDEGAEISFAASHQRGLPESHSLAMDGFEDVEHEDARDSDFPSPSRPARTPRRQTKKRIVYSSDEESDVPPMRMTRTPLVTQEDAAEIEYVGGMEPTAIVQAAVAESITPPQKKGSRSKTAAKDVSKFIDAMARAVGKDDEEEDSDDAGSLDDFIVDDDYVEYEDANGDEEENAYVLTYSPTTPKPRRTPAQTKSITVDLTETSDEEIVEPTVPVGPAGTRPRPRARPPPAKSAQTPGKNRAEKKNWNENKQQLARQIMVELDESVFERKLVEEWKVFPVWNNKLLTTAGRANHKR